MTNIFNNEKIKILCLFFILLLPFFIFTLISGLSLPIKAFVLLFIVIFTGLVIGIFSKNSKIFNKESSKENALFIILLSALVISLIMYASEIYHLVTAEFFVYFTIYNGIIVGILFKNAKKAFLLGFMS